MNHPRTRREPDFDRNGLRNKTFFARSEGAKVGEGVEGKRSGGEEK